MELKYFIWVTMLGQGPLITDGRNSSKVTGPIVGFFDLKSLSLKFGNDTCITFEMPRVSYKRPVAK